MRQHVKDFDFVSKSLQTFSVPDPVHSNAFQTEASCLAEFCPPPFLPAHLPAALLPSNGVLTRTQTPSLC